jgi:hypothetical protein
MRPLLLLVAVAATACSSGTSQHTFVGVVTTTTPRLCVGRPAASGDCFLASEPQLRQLRLGECVSIRYKPLAGSGPRGRAISVGEAKPAPSWCHL